MCNKPIPTLENKSAKRFVDQVDLNSTNKHSIDFSKEINIAKKIIDKSKIQ